MRAIAQATVLALLAVSQPQAQSQPQARPNNDTIAQLRNVTGNVLVSNESGLATGDEGLRLVKGVRVITTARSQVVIDYDDGCSVKLNENERFTVEEGRPCALLVAQPYGIVVAAAAEAIVPNLIVGVLGAAALGALIDARNTTTASPS